MIALLCCLALLQDKPAEQMPPKDEQIELVLAAAYSNRQERIAAAEANLAKLKVDNDWDKLSEKARAKLEKPILDQIKAAKLDKRPYWTQQHPLASKVNDVFQFETKTGEPGVNKEWDGEKTVDTGSVIGFGPQINRKSEVPCRIIISGLKASEYDSKRRSVLKLSGLWKRTDDFQLNGVKYTHIERWESDAEARKLWPKYLADKEATGTKPANSK